MIENFAEAERQIKAVRAIVTAIRQARSEGHHVVCAPQFVGLLAGSLLVQVGGPEIQGDVAFFVERVGRVRLCRDGRPLPVSEPRLTPSTKRRIARLAAKAA